MKRRLKLAASTLLMSLIGGLYWLGWGFFAAGVLAADYAPGERPPEAWLQMKAWLVVGGGFILFAVVIALWRRFDRWLVPGRGGEA